MNSPRATLGGLIYLAAFAIYLIGFAYLAFKALAAWGLQ